jgi:hypothetical protein
MPVFSVKTGTQKTGGLPAAGRLAVPAKAANQEKDTDLKVGHYKIKCKIEHILGVWYGRAIVLCTQVWQAGARWRCR